MADVRTQAALDTMMAINNGLTNSVINQAGEIAVLKEELEALKAKQDSKKETTD